MPAERTKLELWTAVDNYVCESMIPPDAVLDAALRSSAEAGLPSIQVAPNQGKFLHLLARIQGARNILEIGTLGAYSTIWLARALPQGGRLMTLEADPKHAEIARGNLDRAGLSSIAELRAGRAIESLPKILAEGKGPFDFIFIDADKPSLPEYLQWAVKLSRAGTVIVIDNVVREGGVVDASSEDPTIQGVRRMNQLIAAEPRLAATCVQTVGSKGHDGFTLAVVQS